SRIGASHHVSMNICIRIAVQLFHVLHTVHMTQKAHTLAGIIFQVYDPLAAVIRVARDGEDPIRVRLLEALHNQSGIIFRYQAAGDQIIASWFEAILTDNFRMFRNFNIPAISNARGRRIEFLQVELPHAVGVSNDAPGQNLSAQLRVDVEVGFAYGSPLASSPLDPVNIDGAILPEEPGNDAVKC